DQPSLRGARHPRPALATPFVAPQTAAERQLGGVFEELLEVEGVGIDDNFFELGGDSLLATQMLARLSNVLGAELSLRALVDAPTIAALASLAAAPDVH